ALAAQQVLQGLPVHQLHDQVARPALLAVVVHGGDVLVGQRRGVHRLGPQPVQEVLVAGELLTQHLRGHLPAPAQVGGHPPRTHPADREPLGELVALTEDEAGDRLHWSSTACMICRATGAATAPPVPEAPSSSVPSSTTATATCGSSAGAKEVNQALGGTVPSGPSPRVSAVPVLPATCTPEIRAACPVPFSTTLIIMSVIVAAFSAETGSDSTLGSARRVTRRSGPRSVAIR